MSQFSRFRCLGSGGVRFLFDVNASVVVRVPWVLMVQVALLELVEVLVPVVTPAEVGPFSVPPTLLLLLSPVSGDHPPVIESRSTFVS